MNNNEYNMFAPTSAEEAANQSNPNRGLDIVADVLKPNTPTHKWEEGDNWMRFVNTRGNPWYFPVTYYEMKQGSKLARVILKVDREVWAQLLLDVQIGLYTNPESRPLMRDGQNKNGFSFRDHRKAYLMASRWENTLSPFGVVSVTLGREPYKKDQKYKESWGDALIKIPTEMETDPTLASEPGYKPKPRWGSIFDPVDGRLIRCGFTNAGTVDITASFTPAERVTPLGDWIDAEGKVVAARPLPAGCSFQPKPAFAEVLRNVPNLKDCFRRLSIDEQVDMVRMFVPAELLPFAEKIMQLKLSEYRSGGQRKTTAGAAAPAAAPAPAAAAADPAASPAPQAVQVPVPQEEPTELAPQSQLYVEFVKALGPKFKDVGEETARKLISLGLVNAANLKSMTNFPADMLKSIASAS